MRPRVSKVAPPAIKTGADTAVMTERMIAKRYKKTVKEIDRIYTKVYTYRNLGQ